VVFASRVLKTWLQYDTTDIVVVAETSKALITAQRSAGPDSTQLNWLSRVGRCDHNPQVISTQLVQLWHKICDSKHLAVCPVELS